MQTDQALANNRGCVILHTLDSRNWHALPTAMTNCPSPSALPPHNKSVTTSKIVTEGLCSCPMQRNIAVVEAAKASCLMAVEGFTLRSAMRHADVRILATPAGNPSLMHRYTKS